MCDYTEYMSLIILLILLAFPFWQDVSIISTLADDHQTGVFKLRLHSSAPADFTYELWDNDGTVVADAHYNFTGSLTTVADSIPNIRRWTAETPEFYTLVLNINGESASFDVAFRRMEIKSRELFVNGRPIKLNGVHNATDSLLTREDLRLMKKANVNAIINRWGHQPREFYRLCDSIGFYVYNQADVDYKPKWSTDTVKAAISEIKHQYQGVAITPKDTLKGIFTVLNRNYFTSLDKYTVSYWTERDGKRPFWWRKRNLQFNAEPQQTQVFKVKLPRMKRRGEYHLIFQISDGADIVACEDILLKNTAVRKTARPKGKATYTDGDTKIIVRGEELKLVFDKKNGFVQQWKVGGKDMVDPAFGIRPVFRKNAKVRVHKGENGTAVIVVNDSGSRELYTIYPDGAIKADITISHILGLRFKMADEHFRFFGRSLNYFKSIHSSSAPGHYTGTSWLQIGGITVISADEFEFGIDSGEVCINRSADPGTLQSFTFVPKKKTRYYYE